ncbi:MAG: threonine-phosphate decarboxylase CobD [Acetivibrionales bacterium]
MMKETKKHIHGGNIYKASEQYGLDMNNILDYSANINPLGMPQMLRDILISGIDNLANYPDIECTQLVNSISEYLAVDKSRIVVGNGAVEIIFLMFEVLRPKMVYMPAPTFAEYARAAEKYGVEVRFYELKEKDEFRLDMDDFMFQMPQEAGCIFLCNPNNPTSTLYEKHDLIKLCSFCRERGVLLAIDEAFIELTVKGNQNSMVEFLEEYNNLFVIRAFTKVFSIPGLRLGYGLGSREVIRQLWDAKLPWSVNALACSAGRALSCGQDYMDRTARWLEEEKCFMYNALKRIPFLKAFKPQSNFILVKILSENLTSYKLRDIMASEGILIRDASNFTYLNSSFFRIAVKDRKSNEKLLTTLDRVLKEYMSKQKGGKLFE